MLDNSSDSDFRPVESGFSLVVDSIGSLSEDDTSKVFGQIGSLLSVAAFERRNQAVEIMGPDQVRTFPTSDD